MSRSSVLVNLFCHTHRLFKIQLSSTSRWCCLLHPILFSTRLNSPNQYTFSFSIFPLFVFINGQPPGISSHMPGAQSRPDLAIRAALTWPTVQTDFLCPVAILLLWRACAICRWGYRVGGPWVQAVIPAHSLHACAVWEGGVHAWLRKPIMRCPHTSLLNLGRRWFWSAASVIDEVLV